ncbi:MAG: UPF0175 family protein [Chloroflexi bacterium]|nr:UPF0175 family protein [Chloroflexota bacterium]
MANKRFQVDLPEDLVRGFGWTEREVPARVRETLVMDLLRFDKITEAEAADMLGLDRWTLLETMDRYQVEVASPSREELDEELRGPLLGRPLDEDAIKATAGAWVGQVNCEQLERDIYASRERVSDRPEPTF